MRPAPPILPAQPEFMRSPSSMQPVCVLVCGLCAYVYLFACVESFVFFDRT